MASGFLVLGMPEPVEYGNVTTMEKDITLNCTQALSYQNCTLWMMEHTITLLGNSILNISQCEIREITSATG
jgi:hypothetical protein